MVVLAGALLVYPSIAGATGCTLVEVPENAAPKLRVYFTKFPTEDNTAGRYKKCRIVKQPAEGGETFSVTPFRQDANLIVHPSNWPSR